MSAWTEELKQEVIESYVNSNPTPENTTELIEKLAEEYDKTKNGIMMILSKAEVYVKKGSNSSKPAESDKPKRVSKAEAIATLKETIESLNLDVDDTIVDKMTGKAAVYLTELLTKAE